MFCEEGFSGYIILEELFIPRWIFLLHIRKATENLPQKNRFKLCKKGLFDLRKLSWKILLYMLENTNWRKNFAKTRKITLAKNNYALEKQQKNTMFNCSFYFGTIKSRHLVLDFDI